MPEKVKIENIEFPLGGVDRTGEFQEQPPGTTPEAVNVRAVNPDTLRDRGGSRAGLIRYIPGPLFVGADMIQHLNVIVDPQAAALQQVFIVPGDDWVEDPLNPGFFVPPGGWGYQPNPNAPPPAPGGGITFYQVNGTRISDLSAEETFDFDNLFTHEVLPGHTILVAVLMQENSPGAVPGVTNTVTNNAGASYTRIGSAGANSGYERFDNELGHQTTLSLWHRRVATADDETIKINASSAGCFCEWRMIEYDAVATTTPAGFSFDSSSAGGTALTTGTFTLGSANQMAVAAFATDKQGAGILNLTIEAGFDPRQVGVNNNTVQLHFADDVDHGQEVGMSVTATADATCTYAAVGAGFFAS